jgi:hypothetical protein
MQDAHPIGDDGRSVLERAAWRLIGPPLYYCEHCLVGVDVTHGENPVVTRNCGHNDARIIAPRKSILAGEGGLSLKNKAKMTVAKVKSRLTGRT